MRELWREVERDHKYQNGDPMGLPGRVPIKRPGWAVDWLHSGPRPIGSETSSIDYLECNAESVLASVTSGLVKCPQARLSMRSGGQLILFPGFSRPAPLFAGVANGEGPNPRAAAMKTRALLLGAS